VNIQDTTSNKGSLRAKASNNADSNNKDDNDNDDEEVDEEKSFRHKKKFSLFCCF
jgi:hypothetical protein